MKKLKTGDLVKFVYSGKLLGFGIHKDLVGRVGIIIEHLGPGREFYLVSFDDRIVSVAEHQIVAATITHTQIGDHNE